MCHDPTSPPTMGLSVSRTKAGLFSQLLSALLCPDPTSMFTPCSTSAFANALGSLLTLFSLYSVADAALFLCPLASSHCPSCGLVGAAKEKPKGNPTGCRHWGWGVYLWSSKTIAGSLCSCGVSLRGQRILVAVLTGKKDTILATVLYCEETP